MNGHERWTRQFAGEDGRFEFPSIGIEPGRVDALTLGTGVCADIDPILFRGGVGGRRQPRRHDQGYRGDDLFSHRVAVYDLRMIQRTAFCCSLMYSGFHRSLSIWPGDK